MERITSVAVEVEQETEEDKSSIPALIYIGYQSVVFVLFASFPSLIESFPS